MTQLKYLLLLVGFKVKLFFSGFNVNYTMVIVILCAFLSVDAYAVILKVEFSASFIQCLFIQYHKILQKSF